MDRQRTKLETAESERERLELESERQQLMAAKARDEARKAQDELSRANDLHDRTALSLARLKETDEKLKEERDHLALDLEMVTAQQY